MRRIEKQMCAHPHVRLGHGSKDTAHVRVDTSNGKIGIVYLLRKFILNTPQQYFIIIGSLIIVDN